MWYSRVVLMQGPALCSIISYITSESCQKKRETEKKIMFWKTSLLSLLSVSCLYCKTQFSRPPRIPHPPKKVVGSSSNGSSSNSHFGTREEEEEESATWAEATGQKGKRRRKETFAIRGAVGTRRKKTSRKGKKRTVLKPLAIDFFLKKSNNLCRY